MSLASTTVSLPLLPSFRRQQLLLEFASLKHHCPDGIYLTPSPQDPAIWTGVYFVHDGPYASALLRFELLFPPSYPEAPPLVIFSTEIFHPLLVPLTTYTFSSGSVDPTATYSAAESERLPPGALSLRYGFSDWFPIIDRGRTTVRGGDENNGDQSSGREDIVSNEDSVQSEDTPAKSRMKEDPITIRLLKYVKSAFEDPDFLDKVPLEMAGNANAWHAWRFHRGLPKQKTHPESPSARPSTRTEASPRNPADWNWDGVWEARVRDGIGDSVSEALLFGTKNIRSGPSMGDPIRFTKLDDDKLASVQEDMLRMHGFPPGVPRA